MVKIDVGTSPSEKAAAVVTGAGSGIGRAIAIALARAGHAVVCADLDIKGAEATSGSIAAEGGRSLSIHTDVGVYDSVAVAVRSAVDSFGTLGVFVNNAGIDAPGPLLDQDVAEVEKLIRTNVLGVIYGMRAAGRAMRDGGLGGVIINIASAGAYMGVSLMVPYTGSKGAVVAMTRSAAVELAPFGIRCVGVAPGAVNTPLFQSFKATSPETLAIAESIGSQHFRGHLIDVNEIAEVVAFLASPAAVAINGTTILADDGYAQFKTR